MRIVRSAVSAITIAATACGDGTGPSGASLPGQRLVSTSEIADWVWVPGKAEIVFSTPIRYSSTYPPTHLDAVSVPGGSRRTVVAAPTNGDDILGQRFILVGSHVYYRVQRPPYDALALYRAPLDGSSAPEQIMASAPFEVSVSPDERTLAWTESDQPVQRWWLVTIDIASGARRTYPLQREGGHIAWSPSSRSVVVDPGGWSSTGTPLQWVDLTTGSVRLWFDRSPYSDVVPSRDIAWEGESPTAYVVGAQVARYPLATDTGELLSALPVPGVGVGWSPDFATVTIQTPVRCTRTDTGILGPYCARWSMSVDRLAWKSGTRTTILRYDGGTQPEIFPRSSPDGSWLAYMNVGCASCAGLYVVRAP